MIELILAIPVVPILIIALIVVLVETAVLFGWIATLAYLRRPPTDYEASPFARARCHLIVDLGRMCLGLGFLGTLIGLINGTAAARTGAHTALLDNLDLVLHTSALGLVANLVAQSAVILAAPQRVSRLLERRDQTTV